MKEKLSLSEWDLTFILVISKGEVVQVSQDSADDIFPDKSGDLGRGGRWKLVRHSDSGNWNVDTLIFSQCKDKILCFDR